MELDIAIGESYGNWLYLCAKECFCENICLCQDNPLDMTGTPLSRYLTAARLVPHPPRKEKNGIKTRPYRWQNQRKNALLKAWQKVAKKEKKPKKPLYIFLFFSPKAMYCVGG